MCNTYHNIVNLRKQITFFVPQTMNHRSLNIHLNCMFFARCSKNWRRPRDNQQKQLQPWWKLQWNESNVGRGKRKNCNSDKVYDSHDLLRVLKCVNVRYFLLLSLNTIMAMYQKRLPGIILLLFVDVAAAAAADAPSSNFSWSVFGKGYFNCCRCAWIVRSYDMIRSDPILFCIHLPN